MVNPTATVSYMGSHRLDFMGYFKKIKIKRHEFGGGGGWAWEEHWEEQLGGRRKVKGDQNALYYV